MRTHVRHGGVAGLAGGAALALVLLLAGEGPLQRAVDREAGGGDGLVSRAGQRVGGVLAALLVGAALGVVLAVLRAAIRRQRAQRDEPWRGALRLAAVAFLTLNLVPFLKYPPNPPGIGDADTVGRRTALYVILLGWSVLSGWAGLRTWRWLRAREMGHQLAGPAVALTVIGLVGLGLAVLPAGPNPDAVPSSIVWSFRLASLGGWAAYWAVAGTVLGWLELPAGALGGVGRVGRRRGRVSSSG
jgi:hypothetical protein